MNLSKQIIFVAIALIASSLALAAHEPFRVEEIAQDIPELPRVCDKERILRLMDTLNVLEGKAAELIYKNSDFQRAATASSKRFRSEWSRVKADFFSDYKRDVAPLEKKSNSRRKKTGEEEQQAKAVYKQLTMAANTLCEKYYFSENALCPKLLQEYTDYIRNTYIPEVMKTGSNEEESLAAAGLIDLIKTYKAAYKPLLEKDLFYK